MIRSWKAAYEHKHRSLGGLVVVEVEAAHTQPQGWNMMASYLQLTGTNVVWVKTRKLCLGLWGHGVLWGTSLIDDGVLHIVWLKALLGNEVTQVGLHLPTATSITHCKQLTPERWIIPIIHSSDSHFTFQFEYIKGSTEVFKAYIKGSQNPKTT